MPSDDIRRAVDLNDQDIFTEFNRRMRAAAGFNSIQQTWTRSMSNRNSSAAIGMCVRTGILNNGL